MSSGIDAQWPLTVNGDYQSYALDETGMVVAYNERLARKLQAIAAIEVPSVEGRSVLEVGSDHGFFAFYASCEGARCVVGLDRGREVRGRGMVDLVAENTARARMFPRHRRVRFWTINSAVEWRPFGRFDMVLVMSVYHHLYANCGSHVAVWSWLAQHVAQGGDLVWEGPTDLTDPVARRHIPAHFANGYTEGAIRAAAERFFEVVRVGPAEHEPTRQIWLLRRRAPTPWTSRAALISGAGGATIAFARNNDLRRHEIRATLGYLPYPGSLNLHLMRPFPWGDSAFVCGLILDPEVRGDPGSPWLPRWCRFYPVEVIGRRGEKISAHLMRFEGERYAATFAELIAPWRLRDLIQGEEVVLCRSN